MSQLGIVIPVLNQFQLCVEALVSVDTRLPWTPYIVPQYELHWPLSKAWNTGIGWAFNDGCDYALVINDDIKFSSYTIDEIVSLLDEPSCVLATGHNVRETSSPSEIKSIQKPEPSVSEGPDFSCFMITKDTVERIGLFDENFNPAYFEDNDFHYRIKLSGLKALTTTAAPYYHYGSRTQNDNPDSPVVPGHLFEQQRSYYIDKWGGPPGAETYKNPYNDSKYTFKEWRDGETV